MPHSKRTFQNSGYTKSNSMISSRKSIRSSRYKSDLYSNSYYQLQKDYLSWLCKHYNVDVTGKLNQYCQVQNQGSTLPGTKYRPIEQNDFEEENPDDCDPNKEQSAFPTYDGNVKNNDYYHANEVSGYANEIDYDTENQSNINKAMIYSPDSPFYGMDPQLIGFVQKHNVVMDDGAVVNRAAMLTSAALEGKKRKKFIPPGGLTVTKFFVILVGVILSVLVIIIGLSVGLAYAFKVTKPNLPVAKPWWRRTQMYQINVATWANDVSGPVGRLQDVIPRMAYLSSQIGATSIILTNLVAYDPNGITAWDRVSQNVDPGGDAFITLLPQLIQKARNPLGTQAVSTKSSKSIEILLGLPIYSTSRSHSWFTSSESSATSPFAAFYMWTTVPPKTEQEKRFFTYSSTRRAYYRHVHGNSNSPLLNLTNPNVQKEIIKVVEFWEQKLNIRGILITNSTNILPEMIISIENILNKKIDDKFIWFADDPQMDLKINKRNKVCYFTLTINNRVPTRTDDLTAQIEQAFNDTRLQVCSPIWKVLQLSSTNKDFQTIQKLAYFLPGSFLMMAGQEVDLTTGNTELIKWSFINYLNYETYWPNNIMLSENGRQRLLEWNNYWTKTSQISLINTDINTNKLKLIDPFGSENLLVVYRLYESTIYRVYFIVSFQTLNTMIRFRSIFTDLNSPTLEVSYDSKNVYHGRRQFGDEVLMNNEVLILYYY